MWVTFLDVEMRTHNPFEWKNQVYSRMMSNVLLQNILSYKVAITEEQLYRYFGNTPQEDLKSYNPNNTKFWKISLYDLPEIFQKFGMKSYQKLRPDILNYIYDYVKGEKVDFEDFVAVSYLGMMLINPIEVPEVKQNGKNFGCEKEEYFAATLKSMYRYIYQVEQNGTSQIRDLGFLEGHNYSDYIMYDVENKKEKCILLEFAANLPVGDCTKDNTIIGHMHRLVNKYSDLEVVFDRIPGKTVRSQQTSPPIPVKKMWFLYFDQNESTLTEVEELVKKTKEYCQLNIIFCQFDYKKQLMYEKMKFRVKLHNEATFKDYPLF